MAEAKGSALPKREEIDEKYKWKLEHIYDSNDKWEEDFSSEMGAVPADKMEIYSRYYQKPLHSDIRVPHTKWCILRYPNHSMAQLAGMATEAFEDFYFKVCNLDYSKMSKAMDNLVKLMEPATHRPKGACPHYCSG